MPRGPIPPHTRSLTHTHSHPDVFCLAQATDHAALAAEEEVSNPSIWASAAQGNVNAVKAYLILGGSAEARPGAFPNETPMHSAALQGRTEVVSNKIMGCHTCHSNAWAYA